MLTLNVKDVTATKDGLFYKGLPVKRHGDSYKFRLCVAILKDLFPNNNIVLMDRMECIDQAELVKYVNFYAKENNKIQYFGTYVGNITADLHDNVNLITVENFEVKR